MSKTENKLIKIDQPSWGGGQLYYGGNFTFLYGSGSTSILYVLITIVEFFFNYLSTYLLTYLLWMIIIWFTGHNQGQRIGPRWGLGGEVQKKKSRVWSRPNPLPPSGPDRPLLVHTCVNCNPGGSLHNFTTTAQWNTRRGCYFKLKNTQTPLNHVVFHV